MAEDELQIGVKVGGDLQCAKTAIQITKMVSALRFRA